MRRICCAFALAALALPPTAGAAYAPPGDREPNNSPTQAQGPTAPGLFNSGNLVDDDADDYFFYATGPFALNVQAANGATPGGGASGCSLPDATDCEVVVRLLSSAGREIGGIREIAYGTRQNVAFQVPTAGRYVVEVLPAIVEGVKQYELGIAVAPAITDAAVASPAERSRLSAAVTPTRDRAAPFRYTAEGQLFSPLATTPPRRATAGSVSWCNAHRRQSRLAPLRYAPTAPTRLGWRFERAAEPRGSTHRFSAMRSSLRVDPRPGGFAWGSCRPPSALFPNGQVPTAGMRPRYSGIHREGGQALAAPTMPTAVAEPPV